jgi:hemerythrin-like domain-containing protein
MDPLERLAEEHRLMVRVLDAFGRLASRVELGEKPNPSDLDGFITFFSDFEDLNHHDKEESILVPALVRQGYDWYDGPVAALRREHRHERYLLRSLRHAVLRAEHWSEAERRHFVGIATAFIAFLREHMRREGTSVFPEARAKLGAEALAAVGREFERFEAEHDQAVHITRLTQLAEALCERYSD